MRTVHWLFVIGLALFISGIGFIIAGARASRAAAPAAPAVSFTAVATTKQIMNALVSPSSTVVYEAVGTVVDASGVHDFAPKDDQEWAHLAANAAVLAESGNLLLMDGHAVDSGEWAQISRKLIEAADAARKAAENKSTAGVLAAGEAINETCDSCHKTYQRQ